MWNDGVPRIEPGLLPVFSQSWTVRAERSLGTGVSLVTTAAVGMNGTDWFLNGGRERRNPEPHSRTVNSFMLRFTLAPSVSVGFSSGVEREMPWSGREQTNWDSGATLTVTPSDDTWVSTGAFLRRDLISQQRSNVLTASLGTKLGEAPVTLNVNSWMVLGETAEGESSTPVSMATDVSFAWQLTTALWSSLGVAWNADEWGGDKWKTWSAYVHWVLQVTEQVSYGLEVCYSRYAGVFGVQREESNETRVRLSRRYQVSESFSTEMSVEYGFGADEARPTDAPPAFALVGQLLF